MWAAYGGFSALSYLLHAIFPRWEVSASPPPAIFLVLTGFPQGVSRGEGKYGRTALISGAGYPTTPGSQHRLTGSIPWPPGGRHVLGIGRRGKARGWTTGYKSRTWSHSDRGQGHKGLLGLFNADGFPGNDLGWPGWTLHSRNFTFAHKGVPLRTPGPGGLTAPRR